MPVCSPSPSSRRRSCRRNPNSVLSRCSCPGSHPVWALLAAASLGNTLGAVVNWFLGRAIERYGGRRWFPASERQIERASRWYQKWGRWSLLLSWMPIGGDALTVVAGVLREPLPSFLALVAIAKTVRYIVVAILVLQWL
jgi:membrane protein YqaA with SNARE-associated domain